ncbi:MAG: AAA family ATPase, partial [Jatrophihabitans sp.]|uniref:AAA family ATPase n=1 Tax=Jatrophihabitans sp. TaxID=1932789 RepID=UPI003F7D7684
MSNVAVLVERDAILATLRAAVEGAVSSRTPRGALVLLGGEAGVGKTSLVTALLGALGPDVVVRRGWCDDIAVAGALAAVVEAAPEVADELDGDRLQLFGRLRARLVERPTVLVLEDVHWADEATLDLLRWLGRRLGDEPLAVVATYRDDEAHRSPPLTRLVAETASATAGRCLTVAPLTVAGVAELVTGAAASLDAHQLHALTGGNPFYVTEVLAAADVGLPPTVREAVLARVDTLTPAAHRVLDVAAVLGARADAGSLLTLAGEPAAALDECVARGMLVADGDGWSFRHELARRAVDDRLPPGRRAALHAAALAARRALGADDRRLTHHAVGAGDHAAVLQHAPRAATSGAARGPPRVAVELGGLAPRAGAPDPAGGPGGLDALAYVWDTNPHH